MAVLRWHAESHASVERALDLGRGALHLVGSRVRVAVATAELSGDARVIGAYQRPQDAIVSQVPIFRRETGGPAVVAGEGILYLALALSDASALMLCPRDRVLNRNVRPILGALRRLGGSAHYFGREWISLERRPAGLVAWTRQPGGAVLLETFLGAERPYAPSDEELAWAPSGPRMLGKAPITLREALGTPPSARALAEACAAACADMQPLAVEERAIGPLPASPSEHHRAMRWSRPREIPIGFVRAGLAFEASGIVADAALSGDFFQDADAPEKLRAALVGGLATPERLRDVLNAIYGPSGAVIEGLRSLQPVLDGFLELISGVDEEAPPT